MCRAMRCLTAASSGFFLALVSLTAVYGQMVWRVMYASSKICAPKGSTVEIRCSFTYPSRINNIDNRLDQTFWSTRQEGEEFVNVATESEYAGRVENLCTGNQCALRIRKLRDTDVAEYKFMLITNQDHYFGIPGVHLTVTDLQLQVTGSAGALVFKCLSSCPESQHYIWMKNGQESQRNDFQAWTYLGAVLDLDTFSCAIRRYEQFPSPSLYAPKLPSVSARPSAETVEGTLVSLTCSTDANPAPQHSWYKKVELANRFLSSGPELVFSSVQAIHSGFYYCVVKNSLGSKTSDFINIKIEHAPYVPTVAVHPAGEILENKSVTLYCSSDANPAASYTWYKEKQTQPTGRGESFYFPSISSEDRGTYFCRSENKYGWKKSWPLILDVHYAPKLPTVTVSPSAEIDEGSSVTLTCSSDANPAANYTWYKENEDEPKASGEKFTITNFTSQHSGNYYCEATNHRGRRHSTLHLISVARNATKIMNVIRLTLTLFLLIPVPLLCLWIRKKKTPSSAESIELNSGPVYEDVSDFQAFTAGPTEEPEEQEESV